MKYTGSRWVLSPISQETPDGWEVLEVDAADAAMGDIILTLYNGRESRSCWLGLNHDDPDVRAQAITNLRALGISRGTLLRHSLCDYASLAKWMHDYLPDKLVAGTSVAM